MFPRAGAAKVTHDVKKDFGNLFENDMLIGLRDNYDQIRVGIARGGMDKTLENLKRLAEK